MNKLNLSIILLISIFFVMINTKTFNLKNINELSEYGYTITSYPNILNLFFNSQQTPKLDTSVTNLLQSIIRISNYEVNMSHKNKVIQNPITIIDTKLNNVFELHIHVDEFAYPHQCNLIVNGKQTYKFAHVSNVQFYFETINNNFLHLSKI